MEWRTFFTGTGILEAHVHTNFTDGPSYKLVVQTAVKRGVNILAITDHNTMRGYHHIRRYAERYCKKIGKELLILPAQETETDHGDILIYGLEQTIPKKVKLEEAIETTHDHGGLAILAHPHKHFFSFKILPILRNFEFDGVEAYMWFLPAFYNRRIYALLNQFPKLFKIGSADAHLWWEIGWIYNELQLDELNTESVLNALRKHQVKIRKKRLSRPWYLKYFVNCYHVGPYHNAGFFNLLRVVYKVDRRKKRKNQSMD